AETWVSRYLRLHDSGRTAVLNVFQRFASGLGAILSDLLQRDTDCCSPPTVPGSVQRDNAPIQFIAVPPMPPHGNRMVSGRWRAPNGAGLEIDMTDVRERDRLPCELRAGLKASHGFVNYLEAQAVVQTLTRLASDRVRARRHRSGGAFQAPSTLGRRAPN